MSISEAETIYTWLQEHLKTEFGDDVIAEDGDAEEEAQAEAQTDGGRSVCVDTNDHPETI
eukprot:5581776-Amphidinium_carterae.1